jgi:hypothetical protein
MNRRPLTQEEIDDAKRLKILWNSKREDLMLSQVKAAEEMGFSSQAAISQYLNAKLPLNMQAVAKFAQMLRAKVEDISPRYALMVGDPIPSSLDGFTAPQTGSVGGVSTSQCVNWVACSEDFLEILGARSIKVFRMPEKNSKDQAGPLAVLVDDSPQKTVVNGTYLFQQGDEVVIRKVVKIGDKYSIENGKKITIPKDALNLIKILGRVVASIERC